MTSGSAPPRAEHAAAWQQYRERASAFWLRLLFQVALGFGRPAARAILYPVTGYFWATSPAVRKASRAYLRRVLGREPTLREGLRHVFSFAAVSLDRIFILSGRERILTIEETRPPEVARLAASGRGFLLFTSHLGGYETMRAVGTRHRNLPLKILMDREHGRMLMSMLDALNVSMGRFVIDSAQGGPALALEIKQALDSGHMVCMNADRVRGDERTVTVEFLGGPVRLPAAPWLLAHSLRVPVVILFGLYEGGRQYHNHFELFAERVEIPRDRREAALHEYAQRYADRLAHHARLAPFNWFNFYDYWVPA
jgi:predicted LPLAT superfamily acyltransferase